MTAYVEHRADPADKWGTACGATWQGWQAPPGLALAGVAVGGPWSDPAPGDDVRACGACARAKATGVYVPGQREDPIGGRDGMVT